jgi:hypothetical protein
MASAVAAGLARHRHVTPKACKTRVTYSKVSCHCNLHVPSRSTTEREFRGKVPKGKSYNLQAGLFLASHPILPSHPTISPLLPSDFLPPRATVNRNIAMLPSYNSIPHFDTTNPTRAAFRHALGTKRFQFPSPAGRMEEDEEASRLGE